jgi:hypothetical protein
MRALILAVLLASPTLAFAKPAKVTLAAGNGELTLRFDTRKISEAELRAAAALAPESNPDGMTTSTLETCRDAAGKAGSCAGPHTPAQPAFLRDAEFTRTENAAKVAAAAARVVAKELEPAKEWLRKDAAFYAGLEERKLAFYKSWKTADLTPAIEGVDGAKACAAIVAQIDAAASHDAKYELVHNTWHNCMNELQRAAMGDYPAAPWKAFLKAKGVKARFVLPTSD